MGVKTFACLFFFYGTPSTIPNKHYFTERCRFQTPLIYMAPSSWNRDATWRIQRLTFPSVNAIMSQYMSQAIPVSTGELCSFHCMSNYTSNPSVKIIQLITRLIGLIIHGTNTKKKEVSHSASLIVQKISTESVKN